MGLYIKNLNMPKTCDDCKFDWDCCRCEITQEDFFFRNDNFSPYKDRLPNCPLIEIVTCSECKHLEVINGAKIYAHCPMWEIAFKPFEDDTRTNYCSWGEKRGLNGCQRNNGQAGDDSLSADKS